MGEMVSLKGIIAWLPIGNPDTPDFLIVREGKQKITGYFLFDVTLKGKFNQLVTLAAFLKNVANKNWQWIEDISQNKPKYRDVTALVVGVGVDLESDLSYYDYDALNSLFYLHPLNIKTQTQLLHNHGVIFSFRNFPLRSTDLENEISRIIQIEKFLDVTHIHQRVLFGKNLIKGLGTKWVSYEQSQQEKKTKRYRIS